jgi:hypothetical protein
MKNNRFVLLVLCLAGAYGCFWSYKHGPYDLSNIKLPQIPMKQDQKPVDPPPGWNTPQGTPPQFIPPAPKK